MSLLSRIKRPGPSGFGFGSTAERVTAGLDLRGKTILITGVNSGIGLESARVLALRGARILALARTREKAAEATKGFAASVVPIACELSDPASVRAAVAEARAAAPTIDVVLCNAGIMALPKREVRLGHELQFLTNHLGHFLLVTGLIDRLADDGRVVVVSSAGHAMARGGIQFDDIAFERSYDAWRAYGQSKLANILFARGLAKRFAGTKRTANALHPGAIDTNLGRHMNPFLMGAIGVIAWLGIKSVAEGAATSCFVATHPSLAGVSGQYFADCNTAPSTKVSRDSEQAERLWALSEAFAAAN